MRGEAAQSLGAAQARCAVILAPAGRRGGRSGRGARPLGGQAPLDRHGGEALVGLHLHLPVGLGLQGDGFIVGIDEVGELLDRQLYLGDLEAVLVTEDQGQQACVVVVAPQLAVRHPGGAALQGDEHEQAAVFQALRSSLHMRGTAYGAASRSSYSLLAQ